MFHGSLSRKRVCDGLPPHPLRVLCVDDNRDSADSTALLLGLCGYDAVACYDGPSGLAEAARVPPDACLLDLNMPGMDGDELAVRIRDRVPDRRIVFVALTAQVGESATERIRRAGFRHHLIKPVAPDALLAALQPLDDKPLAPHEVIPRAHDDVRRTGR